MPDSMHMQSPVVIAMMAILLLVIVGGVYVAVRIAGQRVVNTEAAVPRSLPPDDHL